MSFAFELFRKRVKGKRTSIASKPRAEIPATLSQVAQQNETHCLFHFPCKNQLKMHPSDTLLRYVAFKKIMYLASIVVAALVIAIALLVGVVSPWREIIVGFLVLLVATEALNSAYMQVLHNMPDRWILLYPFH